jgi:hypothetical protein
MPSATDILKGAGLWQGGGMAGVALGGTLATGFLGAGAALGAYIWKKSQVHPYASEFTGKYQDDFHKRVAAIIDPITQAREKGTLTYKQAQAANDQLETEIADFFSNAQGYAAQGTKQNKVVEQAIGPNGNLTPIITAWRNSLSNDLSRLKPKIKADEIPTMKSMLAKTGQTVQGQTNLAKAQLQKRLAAGGINQYNLGGSNYKAMTTAVRARGY